MIRMVCGAALVALVAAPAIAQEEGEYRAATRTKGPDMSIVQNAVDQLAGGAECNAVFTVGEDGKPRHVEPNCSDPRYDPYIVQAVESMEYEPEIFDGEIFATEGVKQPFVFGVQNAGDGAGGVAPKVVTNVNGGDVERAINRVDEEGLCEVAYVVGTDGKPKDIEPNCDPSRYDSYIVDIIGNMEYEPGMREGAAVDWPMTMPLKLSKPN